MESTSQFLITIGGMLLLGLLTTEVARRTFLPRVTLLLLFGALIGQSGFDVIPKLFSDRFDLIADITLLMVGFLLGSKLTKKTLAHSAKKTIVISLSAAIIASVLVTFSLIAIGVSIELAIILGCIASATDPAAVMDVSSETKTNKKFKNLLLGIVALDDIWALILFSLGMTIVSAMGASTDLNLFFETLKHIAGAVFLGLAIGLPGAYLTGRIKSGKPILSEAIAIVFLCGGLAMWLDVSYLITAMTTGAVIANTAKHHLHPFHAIEGIESLFMLVFFVLAGAALDLASLKSLGAIGLAFIIFRILGKYIGAAVGCKLAQCDSHETKWVGSALFPQAGVAIGMALVASNQFPEFQSTLIPVAITTTLLFEIIGPIFTRMAILNVNKSSKTGKTEQ